MEHIVDIASSRIALHHVLERNTQYLEEHIKRRLRIAKYPEEIFQVGKHAKIIEYYYKTNLGIFYTLEDTTK